MSPGSGSASAISKSVEMLFPGVERSTLTQIIENRFQPTNSYRLLGTEKKRAESPQIINIEGVEFEQTERDGKENNYRMMSIFKAWAVYTGIMVMLAPFALQGELATAMAIYTMKSLRFAGKIHLGRCQSISFPISSQESSKREEYIQPNRVASTG